MKAQLKNHVEYIEKKEILSHPVRVFNLEGLGINQTDFINAMAPSFEKLPYDSYDVKREQMWFLQAKFPEAAEQLKEFLADYYADRKTLADMLSLCDPLSKEDREDLDRIKPYRKRAIARFIIERMSENEKDTIQIHREPVEQFIQSTSTKDLRTLSRTFAEVSDDIAEHPAYKELLRGVAELIKEVCPNFKTITATCHFMSVHSFKDHIGNNAPEGIHQDGADYIISALVIDRKNLTGGESQIFSDDKETLLFSRILQPGEGLFQADHNTRLWHYVTPMSLEPDAEFGYRNIIGFDISVSTE